MLPSREANPDGLHLKYIVRKADGSPVDPKAMYIVLRVDNGGSDPAHAIAARIGARAYAFNAPLHLRRVANDMIAMIDHYDAECPPVPVTDPLPPMPWSTAQTRSAGWPKPSLVAVERDGAAIFIGAPAAVEHAVHCVNAAAKGKQSAPEEEPLRRYAWSFEPESGYNHTCGTIQQARAEAAEEASKYGERPETVFIGDVLPAREVIGERSLGEHIEEWIDDQMYEAIGEVYESLKLGDDQRAELGRLVVDWVVRQVGPLQYAVENAKEYPMLPTAAEEAIRRFASEEGTDHEG